MNIPISYKTLSRYLNGIPKPLELSGIFLAHICEVEGMDIRDDDTIFDLKITPDRGDLLSYLGIAREVSIHSDAKLLNYQKSKIISQKSDTSAILRVSVLEPKSCSRYVGRVIEGVDGRCSPLWLREALEASGQRSINAIVDITNFVMLEIGQPMHAFDLNKLAKNASGEIEIFVRNVKNNEKIETLDGKDIALPCGTLVITDSSRPLAIAGVKGGSYAGISENVNAIVLEAATFDSALVRKSSTTVGIRTDSSRRFEHNRAPESVPIAMDRATELLLEIFPDARVGEIVDVYPRVANPYKVSMCADGVARILGVPYSSSDLARDLDRLQFSYERITNSIERVVSLAKELAGTPYFYGASIRLDAPRKFDCSGFTSYLFLNAGIKIPRISIDQYVFGEKVAIGDISEGDLVFSFNEGQTVYNESIEWMKGTKGPAHGIDHVGVYIGDGMVAHASRHNKSVGPDGGVLIEKLSESPRFKTIVAVCRIDAIKEERFSVIAPPERFDLRIPADIAEEIARLFSYDKIPATTIKNDDFVPVYNGTYGATLIARNVLVKLGFSEIFTYVFRKEGKVEIANPMAEGINFLRDNLSYGMQEALVFNMRNAPLLGVDEILMFEIGTVFLSLEKEEMRISLGIALAKNMKQTKKDARESEVIVSAQNALADALGTELFWTKKGNVCECVLTVKENVSREYIQLFASSSLYPYHKISAYPFVLRDIAMWANDKITQDDILTIIRNEGGELLVRDRLFDVFKKEVDGVSKSSYAFNLVFQSYEKTLSDIEVNEIMARINTALSMHELEVR